MIYDSLRHLATYQGLDANLDQAIERLLVGGFENLAPGKYEVDGDRVFFFIQENVLAEEASENFEYHRKYADIHWVMEGAELVSYGYRLLEEEGDFNAKEDIGFVPSEKWLDCLLDGQTFALFFPGEIHQPNQSAGQGKSVRKCVFKVRIDD